MVSVADLSASMSRMEAMLRQMHDILDSFNGVSSVSSSSSTVSAPSTTARASYTTTSSTPTPQSIAMEQQIATQLEHAQEAPMVTRRSAPTTASTPPAPSTTTSAPPPSSTAAWTTKTPGGAFLSLADGQEVSLSTQSHYAGTIDSVAAGITRRTTSATLASLVDADHNRSKATQPLPSLSAPLTTTHACFPSSPTTSTTAWPSSTTKPSATAAAPSAPSPSPVSKLASVIGSSSVPTTSFSSARKVFDGMPCNQEAPAASVLHVMVTNMLYPVSMEVMHQLFNPYGAKKVQLFLATNQAEGLISFQSYNDAVQACEALHGRCIWDDCCMMNISHVPPTIVSVAPSSPNVVSMLTVEEPANVMRCATTTASPTKEKELVTSSRTSTQDASTTGIDSPTGSSMVTPAKNTSPASLAVWDVPTSRDLQAPHSPSAGDDLANTTPTRTSSATSALASTLLSAKDVATGISEGCNYEQAVLMTKPIVVMFTSINKLWKFFSFDQREVQLNPPRSPFMRYVITCDEVQLRPPPWPTFTCMTVPSASCEQCGNHQDPRFQPDLSSSYSPVKCNVDCTCDSDKKQCTYERQYAEMSSSSGVLGEDIVSFGRESELKPQRAVFGCENSETGDLFSQHADGIMGLGRGQLSIMDQLVEKGVISDSFSLCYGGMDIGGGAMVLGGVPAPSDMVFSHSDPLRSPYYNIELKEIHVAGKALRVDSRIFDSKHGTVLDSGTTYAYLPEQAFVAFRDAVTSKVHSLKKIRGPDPNYKDICFAGAGRNVSKLHEVFPDVDMVFGNGQKLSLTPENYLFRHSKVDGAYCLGVFQNGKDPTTLLGGIIVRNTLVTYDRHNEKIGFWKTNCSELWERLHISDAPSPAPSSDTNSETDMSPAPAPSSLPEFDVGLITVDMSINVTYPNLKPHLHELAKLIAKELEIDSRQVRVMDITSQGNSTLIRWGIFPAGSDNAMSNATAMGIIYRLTQHHVQLPENLGSYQLLEWNVQPLPRRSWFQEHVISILLGILLVVLVTLSAFLVVLVWRKKFSGQTAYRPVDSLAPEQELQPL